MLINDILQAVGNTPLLKLNELKKQLNLKADIYAKLECFNPAGSSKDRVALNIINDAEKSGLITAGGTVIEATSGNTGIGLAVVCKAKGYNLVLVMPETVSVERIKILKAYGAKVVLTNGSLGMQGATDKALEIKNSTPNSFIADQFNNVNNPLAHYKTTAVEIFNDLNGNVDFFVCGVGTGGTFTGTAKFLKEKIKNVKAYVVEPESSPLISKGYAGAHKIQGIGANFIPNTLDKTLIDGVITCSDEDAFKYAKLLAKTEAVLVGISSGAALKGAIELAKLSENEGKNIVVVLPDGADRYYSTALFEN